MLRSFIRFNKLFQFSTEVQKSIPPPASHGLTYYSEGQLQTRSALVLKKSEDI